MCETGCELDPPGRHAHAIRAALERTHRDEPRDEYPHDEPYDEPQLRHTSNVDADRRGVMTVPSRDQQDRGSARTKALPVSVLASSHSRPPCCSATRRLMCSPKPVPGRCRVRDERK